MTTVKQKSTRMKRPQNRKFMIRDLPVGAAYLLHPSLRGILMNRQKRWNSGSPPHRIAVNLVRRYKRQLKPRVLPFFCDKCRLGSRTISVIKNHTCDKEDKRKAERREPTRRYAKYDYSADIKIAANPEKQWRYSGMSVLERTLRPNKVAPKRAEIEKMPTELEPIDKEPDPEFYAAQEQEFEDETPHYPLHEVLIPSTQVRPKTTLPRMDCTGHREAGVFCFNCKGSFDSYNQYQLHLKPDFDGGRCNRALPDYYYTEKNDQTGVFNKKHRHSLMHHIPVKRDVSHIQCTLCKAINFASTGDLYSHMIKCATAADQGNESPLSVPTKFGYGLPPSFNANQYVFPDPKRERAPRQKSTTADSVKTEDVCESCDDTSCDASQHALNGVCNGISNAVLADAPVVDSAMDPAEDPIESAIEGSNGAPVEHPIVSATDVPIHKPIDASIEASIEPETKPIKDSVIKISIETVNGTAH